MYEDASEIIRAIIGYNLSDAQDHLGELLQEMKDDPEFGEAEFRLGLAHVYAHLNRAWHQRNASEEEIDQPDAHWEIWSRFPTGIQPIA